MNFIIVLLMGFSSWIWPLHLSDDIILHDSPLYAEDCTPLFNATDDYKWHCVGKWKVPGLCKAIKGKDGKIYITCVQCFGKAENGRHERITCPVQDVDELLKVMKHGAKQ